MLLGASPRIKREISGSALMAEVSAAMTANHSALLPPHQGLANNYVLSITEDKTGNLWFGTVGGGVSRYDGKSFSTFTTAQGLANNFVTSITEDKTGNLWFGTYGGGVSRYDGKSFSTFTTAQGLAHNIV